MTADGPRSAASDATGEAVVDVVTLGESMVAFLPSRPGPLAGVPSFDRAVGGAESNVACALAAAGHTARWVGRVGADGFGDHLVGAIGAYGVDVSAVRRDPARPTGVYFRTAGDRATDAHEVAYYRAGSAASAMSPRTVDLAAVRAGRVLHLSGITAALSAGCLRLARELTARRAGRPRVSFDVNYRSGLWDRAAAGGPGPEVLLELARGADIVFVGDDEARDAWGLRGARAVRDALPEPGLLVVKQGPGGAVAFGRGADGDGIATGDGIAAGGGIATGNRIAAGGGIATGDGDRAGGEGPDGCAAPGGCEDAGGRAESAGYGDRAGCAAPDGCGDAAGCEVADRTATHVRAPRVDVVAAVGAGDAFAAGFLSATLRGLPVRYRLRHDHLWAAAALTVPGDLAPPPPRGLADRLAALDDAAWGELRLGPGWTRAGRAVEEVPTP